jgi:hypothetical protein
MLINISSVINSVASLCGIFFKVNLPWLQPHLLVIEALEY